MRTIMESIEDIGKNLEKKSHDILNTVRLMHFTEVPFRKDEIR
jgi:hypothetical protein